jgi:hypothetical protein
MKYKWSEEFLYVVIFIIMCVGGIYFIFSETYSSKNVSVEKHKVIVIDEIYSSKNNYSTVSSDQNILYFKVKDSVGREIIIPSNGNNIVKNDTLILNLEVTKVKNNKIFKIINYENKH